MLALILRCASCRRTPLPLLSPAAVCSPLPPSPAGFPTTSIYGEQVFKFTELQGQGIEGADLPCAPSIVPGKCALPVVDEAMLVCHAMGGLCKAVTVYFNGAVSLGGSCMARGAGRKAEQASCAALLSRQPPQPPRRPCCFTSAQLPALACRLPTLPSGLDGCSGSPVAVLKTAAPYPDNSWVSPHVSTLVNFEPPDSCEWPRLAVLRELLTCTCTQAAMHLNGAL